MTIKRAEVEQGEWHFCSMVLSPQLGPWELCTDFHVRTFDSVWPSYWAEHIRYPERILFARPKGSKQPFQRVEE
jgi:hypothetical protein